MKPGIIVAASALLLFGLGMGGGGFSTGDLPKPGGGGGGGGKPKPGGSKPKPGGGTIPKPTAGRTFGTGTAPPGWDPTGNGFWISPDCDLVLEGEAFEPASHGQKTINAASEPTLSETLANKQVAGPNSVYGFVDYLMEFRGFQTPEEIAIEIMREANPLCADVFPANAPAALSAWFDSFTERIAPWVNVAVIGFDPEEDTDA